MRIKNLPSIESMDGSQDALVIEQTDGSEDKSRKVSPAQIKQYVLNDMDEVPTQNSNNPVKSGGIFSAIDDVYSVMGQNGAKNLIPYPYANSSITDHDVTFTVNNDGTVIANGTANGTAQLHLVLGKVSLSDPGNLVINTNKPLFLSGCPSGGSHSTFRIQYGLTDGTTYWAKTASDIGSGVKITPVDGLNSYCFVVIKIMVFDGYTANSLTFKPMLHLASDTDNTYQSYVKTNRQLTEEIGDLSQTGLTGDSVSEQLANFSNFLSFTHFVQIPFTNSVLDSIKTAFENNTIPVDLFGITFGIVRGDAGSQRVIFIAQNQRLSTTQTRYAAIYFGAYTAPRFLQKQDGTDWTDVAL